MNIPQGLKYTKDHEWVRIEGDIATVGVTDFAQGELGDIVFVVRRDTLPVWRLLPALPAPGHPHPAHAQLFFRSSFSLTPLTASEPSRIQAPARNGHRKPSMDCVRELRGAAYPAAVTASRGSRRSSAVSPPAAPCPPRYRPSCARQPAGIRS